MPDEFERSQQFERIDSPFELDPGDRVTVVENNKSGRDDVLTEDVEVTDVSRGGFAGEPEFEFEGVSDSKRVYNIGDQILDATEGGPRDRTAYRRQQTDTTAVGEFAPLETELQKAIDEHEARPQISQRRDEGRRARVTTDFNKWRTDMDSFDFPGVDTPSGNPDAQKKDRPFVDEDSLLGDVF